MAVLSAGAAGALVDPDSEPIRRRIADYYTSKVKRFGCTPFGVDWTCIATQEMRFVQLLKLCNLSLPFTMNDLGCGYGAMVGFLQRQYSACNIDYLGVDLSKEMVRRARRQWRRVERVRFVEGYHSPRTADYSVASGIFNVRQAESHDSWEAFIRETLQHLAATSSRGFAVNFVEAFPCGERGVPGLYTTTPEPWIGFCVDHIGADVEVIEGYGMREFSLLVRPRRCG
jgi:SAM-dependent methyltransferase